MLEFGKSVKNILGIIHKNGENHQNTEGVIELDFDKKNKKMVLTTTKKLFIRL
jgi:DNA polymerase elongation subunit (family B)